MGKGSNRPRRSSSKYVTTHSGSQLKIHRSLGERWMARRELKARRKVQRMQGLPKSRFKRTLWRLHPKRLAAYWFSRDGAIMALKIAGIGILVLFIVTLAVFAYFRKDLPSITDISGGNLGGSISYYDRSGQTLLWQDYNAIKRVPVASGDISKYVKDATIATEDRNFYNEKGFDIKSIIRAAFNDIFHRGGTQGGSTITQQLVKITQEWTKERTLTRKVKELILAVELERSYTKDEILTGYLNAAPYGGVDHGVQAAASDYFHKSAKDLTLPESAMLAAIPKAPGYYSPYSPYFERSLFNARYNYVLDSMVQTGKIKKSEAEAAKKFDVIATVQPQQTKYAGIRSPYFVLAAKNELSNTFLSGENGSGSSKAGGWKVITTLDTKLQDLAEQQVQKGIAQVRRQGGDEAALAAEDVKTGQMVALVGGVDFANSEYGQINYAQTPLPPGSSFKPYDYTALIENSNSAGAGSVLYDVQQAIPGYPCTNKALPKNGGNCLEDYDFRYPGPMTLRYALGGSRNVPAVKAMLITGVDKTIKTAEAMGLKSGYKCYSDQKLTQTTQCYGASGIGDGAFLHLDEHVHGFSTISRLGNYIPQTYIMKIYGSKSSTKPFYEWKQPKGKQVVRQDAAYIVADIISDPKPSYFPAGRKPHRFKGWNFAMKTGTTAEGKDGWMIGFSTKYAAGAWVGYHTRQKTLSGTMENMTQPIWQGWMNAAHDGVTPANWTEPSDIQHQPAYVVTSHVGIGSVEPSPGTEIYPSWYKPKATTTKNATIDKVSGKLATDCTPSLAKQTQGGNSTADHFSIDIFYGNGAATNPNNTTANDDAHSCSDSKPTISVFIDGTDVSNGGNATCTGSCSITATVSAGTHPFNDPAHPQFPGTVNLLVNGQVVQSQSAADPSDTKTFTYSGSGSVTIAVQVIDSVLYDATSGNATVSFAAAAPATPTFSISRSGTNDNKIDWSSVSGATSYKVYWTGAGGSSPQTVVTTTYTIPGGSSASNVRVEAYTGTTLIAQSS